MQIVAGIQECQIRNRMQILRVALCRQKANHTFLQPFKFLTFQTILVNGSLHLSNQGLFPSIQCLDGRNMELQPFLPLLLLSHALGILSVNMLQTPGNLSSSLVLEPVKRESLGVTINLTDRLYVEQE